MGARRRTRCQTGVQDVHLGGRLRANGPSIRPLHRMCRFAPSPFVLVLTVANGATATPRRCSDEVPAHDLREEGGRPAGRICRPRMRRANMQRWNDYSAGRGRSREAARRRGPAADRDRYDGAAGRRRARAQRRAVRRDQGSPRRLLPARLRRTSTRRSSGPRRSRACPTAARSRCAPRCSSRAARTSSPSTRARDRRPDGSTRAGRPPVPGVLGAGGRDAHPRARRLHARGGRRSGGVRCRARALARRRGPRQPGGLDRRHCAQPRDRPPAPRAAARGQGRGADTARAERRRERIRHERHPRRPATPLLHLLPSGARDRRARRPDAAHARRPVDAGGRARAPHDGARHGAAARAREAKDRRPRGSAYEVPAAHELPDRLAAVLASLYLVFNEGYAATSGDVLDPPRAVRGGDPARWRALRA